MTFHQHGEWAAAECSFLGELYQISDITYPKISVCPASALMQSAERQTKVIIIIINNKGSGVESTIVPKCSRE